MSSETGVHEIETKPAGCAGNLFIDGARLFIDKKPARIKQTADSGQELSTGKSRAELLFDRRALGFLGNNSLIKLGEECFRLDQGQVLINGPQSACLGSKVLGIRGTTSV